MDKQIDELAECIDECVGRILDMEYGELLDEGTLEDLITEYGEEIFQLGWKEELHGNESFLLGRADALDDMQGHIALLRKETRKIT